jgi:hypothetical protein
MTDPKVKNNQLQWKVVHNWNCGGIKSGDSIIPIEGYLHERVVLVVKDREPPSTFDLCKEFGYGYSEFITKVKAGDRYIINHNKLKIFRKTGEIKQYDIITSDILDISFDLENRLRLSLIENVGDRPRNTALLNLVLQMKLAVSEFDTFYKDERFYLYLISNIAFPIAKLAITSIESLERLVEQKRQYYDIGQVILITIDEIQDTNGDKVLFHFLKFVEMFTEFSKYFQN